MVVQCVQLNCARASSAISCYFIFVAVQPILLVSEHSWFHFFPPPSLVWPSLVLLPVTKACDPVRTPLRLPLHSSSTGISLTDHLKFGTLLFSIPSPLRFRILSIQTRHT
ncbi:hypothetical protein RRG08_039666 [Elysia crispata]|uniref:Uncharacterized protein n=1 Tax=Elysia crispata TaxID=231223 RepID=A0AAE0YAR5_9GAST|nr:hypothetical protein RRG08_039666 [Elysia crispata]